MTIKNPLSDIVVKYVLIAMLGLTSVVGGMTGWYIKVLTTEIRIVKQEVTDLSKAVLRLTVALEIQAGGNPFTLEDE